MFTLLGTGGAGHIGGGYTTAVLDVSMFRSHISNIQRKVWFPHRRLVFASLNYSLCKRQLIAVDKLMTHAQPPLPVIHADFCFLYFSAININAVHIYSKDQVKKKLLAEVCFLLFSLYNFEQCCLSRRAPHLAAVNVQSK